MLAARIYKLDLTTGTDKLQTENARDTVRPTLPENVGDE